jgi:hypothetical protein
MKKVVLVIISLIIFLPLTIFICYAESCDNSFDIFLEIEAYEDRVISKYQFPDFKEDSFLKIKSIKIVNTGNCSLPEAYLQIVLIESNNQVDRQFFCTPIHGILIPEISVGNQYKIFDKSFNDYEDSSENKITFCLNKLTSVGKWTIYGEWEFKKYNGGYGWNFKVNDGFLKQFNVISRSEIESLELANKNLQTTVEGQKIQLIIAILGLIFSPLLSVFLQCKFIEKNNEKISKSQIYYLKEIKKLLNHVNNKLTPHTRR